MGAQPFWGLNLFGAEIRSLTVGSGCSDSTRLAEPAHLAGSH
jgi:hypothetical protein